MTVELGALVAHARDVPAEQRGELARRLRAELPAGSLLLETCHRVELYGRAAEIAPLAERSAGSSGISACSGLAAARHLLQVAIGRQSVVIAEDQLLHQLRLATSQARSRGPLVPELERLADLALRAGRKARSWLPARRRSLAEVAIERVLAQPGRGLGDVLVVGAGEMGSRAARTLSARGAGLLVASRTPERAAALAKALRVRTSEFDPGPEQASRLSGVLLALSGPWAIQPATQDALVDSAAWLVDLSAPPAVPGDLARRLGRRLISIDDLTSATSVDQPSQALLERLDALVEETLDEYLSWVIHDEQRDAARALAERAERVRAAELEALWQRVPQLADEQRAEVAHMARHLTERLLRDPLEALGEDGDGRQANAARELFRL